ncbi:hypothetical protein COCCADRAFT_3880 [Bipolaris zeicola 26-R-13]|uniref:Uncharacterized protein n=1 Tax=Cochliobolus carbonum (strain 26-R-13) TaxID=930089 RepID=W6YTE6_COCC2|nr:uncharacterized protein COCCADRAFT_3880 [Bipolaris zeicola 26-R-13]EUC34786.1 hypothetical protein COCCADRAFT_3880 [Bipolaris zeicola 26-R-13]
MSLTPSNSRMSPAVGSGIKLTASPSPFYKATPRASPVKQARAEVNLSLRQVIGTTTNSPNAFDSLPSGSTFGYAAGAAAVIAAIDDRGHVTQRFYRARPATNPINPSASIYGGPSTPTQNESRNRTAVSLRDASFGASSASSPSSQDWADSPNNKAWTTRDKIKAATCVSFSPDGRYFATGYKPRVLIFSASPDVPCDTPLSSLTDHTFGVNCVAFSPDSRFLASLGSANDGFLYIWHINSRSGAATLHASNKCVSRINRMAWMGNKLITVGVRHVKVWKIDDINTTLRITRGRQSDASFLSSSMHKTLPGRNCILDSLKESTFTSVVAIARNKAIVASDKGDICLIDDSESDQRFRKLADAGFAVSSLAADVKGRLHVVGSQGTLKTFNISEITGIRTPPPSPPPRVQSPTVPVTDCEQIGVIACLKDYVVTVDSQRAIRLSQLCSDDDDAVVGKVVRTLPAHGKAVLGVHAGLAQPNVFDASYYTWAADGTVIFWSQGACKDSLQVYLEQLDDPEAIPNELRTVRITADGTHLIAGDKFGVLRFINCETKTCMLEFKAHASEITSIAIHEEEQEIFVASASRDRTVQVFTRTGETWDLLQTLDEHVGSVNGVTFSRDGTRLVSSSSDRSLVVRERLSLEDANGTNRAFVMSRAIIVKATPVSTAWDVDLDDTLLVSTIDRQVHKFDIRTGQCLSNFRACDTDGGDAVVLSSLVHISRGWGAPLIAGVSSTDKSIRVYDDNGLLVARDWGHTEGVSNIALVNTPQSLADESSEKSLVTVAVDGTIFVWDLGIQTPSRPDPPKAPDLLAPNTPSKEDLLSNRPPLRRVLSQSELARYQRSNQEGDSTPSGSRSPKLRKKLSKISLGSTSTPKLEPSPIPSSARDGQTTCQEKGTGRRNKNRSPSPPSPRNTQRPKRRGSTDARNRNKAPAREFGTIDGSTESLCRTLRAYRKRLANSTDTMSPELAKEVERELAVTARAIGDRVKTKAFEETVMIKLLDQYSERLVNMLDEKIAASVAQRVRESSVGNFSDGPDSPRVSHRPSASRTDSEDMRSFREEFDSGAEVQDSKKK